MAIVRKLEPITLERDSKHTEVNATYTVIHDPEGDFLQIDTYGSVDRQEIGKKSQSIRLSPTALIQLESLLKKLKFRG
ncbi:hypothetical protein [Thiomicrorhabdus sp.]|uniref:hypothetical protein n=1 Tax=Thiomicrorhabdus sp. TaxID=2039724 RepID=UPI0029C69D4E|nr:hypothetical protein [Thiomicrorhabdus sp.]